MFYYKTFENNELVQLETRDEQIVNLPDNMVEITEEEYNITLAEIEKKWAGTERPVNPYAPITTEEANEAIREGVNAI